MRFLTIICIILLLVFVFACSKGSDQGEAAEASVEEHETAGQVEAEQEQGEHAGLESEPGEHAGEGERGEHSGEGEKGEHSEEGEHAEEGEETGLRIAKDGTHNEVRKGVRLILSFDNESSSFIGTVENVTEKTVSRVRVEVHLSNGIELGPTDPIELAPGEKMEITLSADGQTFSWWKAHAEAGVSEHGIF